MRKYTLPILILIFLPGTIGCKKHDTSSPLDFTYSGTLHTGYLITFHSNAGTCLWSFGDGSKSTDPNPNHTYSYASSFTVTLIADNDTTKKVTKTIVIEQPFDFTYSGTPAAGYTVSFTSNAPAGNSFLWDFGDGTTSTDAAPAHIFSANNSFDVSLTLNNDPDHIIKKTINIYANGIYLSLIAGTKTWHHIYTDASPYPPYHTSHTLADVNKTITYIAPSVIAIDGDTLTYSNSIQSDSVLVFYHSDLYKNINNSLYFNHFTSGTDYYQYVHISAGAGDADDHYYTP